jgi:uncharacterized protein YjbI with pentapeptide repeats
MQRSSVVANLAPAILAQSNIDSNHRGVLDNSAQAIFIQAFLARAILAQAVLAQAILTYAALAQAVS